MRLTYKYPLRPTKTQQRQLEAMLEVCRSVYNATLATRKNAYEQRSESLSYYDTKKLLPRWKLNFTAMMSVHSQVLQDVTMRVDLAFQAFFRRIKAGETLGYPRFKGKGRYRSLTYSQYGNGVKLDGDTLTLSKVGMVRVKLHRPMTKSTKGIEGEIKTVTVQRDSVGKWEVCFSCEVEFTPLPVTHKDVGIDLGLKTFAVKPDASDPIRRERWMKRDAKDIARLQRKKERALQATTAQGTPERQKVVHALQHAYRRAANRRDNFAHQESRKLVNAYDFMAFERLDIRDMLVAKPRGLGNTVINRSIADVAWGKFVQYTLYKAENAGRAVVLVGRSMRHDAGMQWLRRSGSQSVERSGT